MPGTLICYGDSNTYGYDPHDTNEGRYPKEVRWTGILDTETDWKVENHGVNGRSKIASQSYTSSTGAG